MNAVLCGVYDKCVELKRISSTATKKSYLSKFDYDYDFRNFLKFLLNPRAITGISKAKMKKKVNVTCGEHGKSLDELYQYLTENNTGTDSDISYCQKTIDYLCGDSKVHRDFLEAFITKTLKLGVDVKTVNAVYGENFIPVHSVMLGSPRDKLRLKKDEKFFLSEKMNGVRGTYVNGKLVSRQGIPFKGLEHIEEELNLINTKLERNYVFDGELIRNNYDNLSNNDNFKLGTGIINSDTEDKKCICFVIFDVLPYEEFLEGKSKSNYKERKKLLCELNKLFFSFNYLYLVKMYYEGTDINKIDEWLNYAESHDIEGVMLNKDKPYVTKRTSDLIKIKKFKYSDLRIVDFEEGSGKYVNKLGAFIVEYKNNLVHVGSGIEDCLREAYWNNRENLIGKIITVKYKEETTDKKTKLLSLQFPTFVMLREDKTEPSYE